MNSQIYIDHADVVVTHECMNHCPFCIDKFVHTSNEVVKKEDLIRFLKKLRSVTSRKLEVLFLGGEPTCAGIEKLAELTDIVREFSFSPIISTNNPKKELIVKLLPYFDWIQVTVHSDKQIEFYRQYKDRINIKLSGDKNLTLEKLNHFIDVTKDFERKSISMYFTPLWKELCTDEEVWSLLNKLSWTRNGSYVYTFYQGVRIKRCIHGETNLVDEPSVPKLYPNGNYNKTWNNETLDDYLK